MNGEDVISKIEEFLKSKEKSPRRSIRIAAQNALVRLRDVERKTSGSGYSYDEEKGIRDYVLGDRSQFFTPEEIQSMGDEIRQSELKDIEEGRLMDNGGIFGYEPVSFRQLEWRPPMSLFNKDGNFLVGTTFDEYMKNLPGIPGRKTEGLFRGMNPYISENLPEEKRYYAFDEFKPKDYEEYVISDFIGHPNRFDVEYNSRYADSIKKGERPKRYAGPQRWVKIRRIYKDGTKRDFYKNIDQIPLNAETWSNADFFPVAGLEPLPPGAGNSAINNWMSQSKKLSPWEPLGELETNQRTVGRNVPIDRKDGTRLDEDKFLQRESIGQFDFPFFKDKGTVYTHGPHADSVTGQIYSYNQDEFLKVGKPSQEANIARKLAEKEKTHPPIKEGVSLLNYHAYGGRLRTAPKTLRDRYGHRLGRAEGLGNDDYDVYF